MSATVKHPADADEIVHASFIINNEVFGAETIKQPDKMPIEQ